MRRSVDLIRKAFEHQNPDRLPRGELWLGTELFQKAQLKDNVEGHLKLRNHLGMDLLFLPLVAPRISNPVLGYRYFSLDEVQEAVKISALFVGVIIDGPFQRLVEKQGLVSLLKAWRKNEQVIIQEYKKEAAEVNILITQCLRLKVGAVVIADDLAWKDSTYFNPDDLKGLLTHFYAKAVTRIHAGGAYALFHSCGNINGVIPQLTACGFDGLAACQTQCSDLTLLKKEYGSKLTFLAGIEADLLETEPLTLSQRRKFAKRVNSLAKGGGFILCSSCGLYSSNFLESLPKLYRLAEESLTLLNRNQGLIHF